MRAFLEELRILKDVLRLFDISTKMRPNIFVHKINEKSNLCWNTSAWIIDIDIEMDMFNSVFWALKSMDSDFFIFNHNYSSDKEYVRIEMWNSIPVSLENYNLEDITIVIICDNGKLSLACRAPARGS